jgi:tetratricopeptide (TPR) repeat protein
MEARIPVSSQLLHSRREFQRTVARLCALATALLSLTGSGCGMLAYEQNTEGVRFFQEANYQAAVDRFQAAAQNDPYNADAYYNLAATYQRLGTTYQRPGDLAQAENLYHQCLDRDPNHKDCYRGLAVLLAQQGRTDEAFKLVQGWSDRNPALADARVELARLHEEYGDRDKAMSQLVDALNVAPNNTRALTALGRLREQAGDTSQALANYSRALQQDSNQPELASRVAALQGRPYGTQPLSPNTPGSQLASPQMTTTWR